MGFYTPTVDNLLRNKFDLGLKDYPIFDENYRETLNNKIIDHYRFREIGLETPMLFKLYLNRKMNEIMPYYNQLYASELLEFDPITNFEYTEKFDGKHIGNKQDTKHTTDTENKTSDRTKAGSENEDKSERESIGTGASEHTSHDSSTSVDETTGREETSHNSSDSQTDTENVEQPLSQNGSKSWSKNVYSDTPQGLLSGSWEDYVTNNVHASNGGYTVNHTDLKDRHIQTDTDSATTTQTDNISNSDTVLNRDSHTNDTTDKLSDKTEDRDTSYDKQSQYTDNEDYTHDINSTSDMVGTTDVDNTDDNLTHVTGYKNISPSDLLNKFRDTFLNIDMMIIDDLSELFMSIY